MTLKSSDKYSFCFFHLIIKKSLEMMRNPSLMNEMMRNADRAMSNIENHPEGFGLLRRLYTNVQVIRLGECIHK